MATGTHRGSTWDTNAGNKTVIATPAVGDLIVVVHAITNWVSGDDSIISDNNADGFGTYTKFGTTSAPASQQGGTGGAMWFSIRNQLIGSATSTTFTATNTGDSGGGLTVISFSGMTYVGGGAVRQWKGESTQSESPPTLTFSATTDTNNPIILGVIGEDNPAGITQPTGFTLATDTGWNTPSTGVHVCWDDAGNTATLFSWTGGALTDHNEIGIELDTRAITNPGYYPGGGVW